MNKYNIGDIVYNKEGVKGEITSIRLTHSNGVEYDIKENEDQWCSRFNSEDSLGWTQEEAKNNNNIICLKGLKNDVMILNKEIQKIEEEMKNVKTN